MNQMLPSVIIDSLMSMLPVKEKPAVMSRKARLLHWAGLVRRFWGDLYIFHLLEYQRPDQLHKIGHPSSAFDLAGNDPVLQDQGIKKDTTQGGVLTTSAAEVMRFFELSQQELHEFSCDCGGAISPERQADRIEAIASRG